MRLSSTGANSCFKSFKVIEHFEIHFQIENFFFEFAADFTNGLIHNIPQNIADSISFWFNNFFFSAILKFYANFKWIFSFDEIESCSGNYLVKQLELILYSISRITSVALVKKCVKYLKKYREHIFGRYLRMVNMTRSVNSH